MKNLFGKFFFLVIIAIVVIIWFKAPSSLEMRIKEVKPTFGCNDFIALGTSETGEKSASEDRMFGESLSIISATEDEIHGFKRSIETSRLTTIPFPFMGKEYKVTKEREDLYTLLPTDSKMRVIVELFRGGDGGITIAPECTK